MWSSVIVQLRLDAPVPISAAACGNVAARCTALPASVHLRRRMHDGMRGLLRL